MGTPYFVLWLFTKGLAIVLMGNTLLLASVGVFKAAYLFKTRAVKKNVTE
ncbi:hypothetical protein [Ruminococcus sp. FC2018]|nr:hypothetical protein [Ruminococcus sp. FC2018]